ncbi:MAG: RsmB/NOP family class I SAM-dependent RNA methyltransferase [Lachnospiraceae bacterium]|nr:RsmB/NOP family class I SAM-dependent RNA methyltransferase [Lachnospiraceae bacterium]
MKSFPDEFLSRMKDMLGDEFDDFMSSYERPVLDGLRTNTLKISPEELAGLTGEDVELSERVPWNPDGFYIKDKRSFSLSPYYHAGLYYIQEPSAMLPAALACAKPGERVLDLCAAPGGKSTAVAAAMKNEGILISNDISRSRAKALLHNIEAFGISNCVVTSESPEKLAKVLPGFFDKILIDAPCSGEGMFHKEPRMTESWKKNGPDFYRELQESIITSAALMLAPGGRIIYSTCTFSPQEDEGLISWFLSSNPYFRLVDPSDLPESRRFDTLTCGNPQWGDGNPELDRTLRVFPHKVLGEGHFAAVLERKAAEGKVSSSSRASSARSKHKELAPFYEFLISEGILAEFDESRLQLSDGYLRYVPEGMPELRSIYVMRSGLFLGEIRSGRFTPSGAFARYLSPAMVTKCLDLPAGSPEAAKYLKCETLNVDRALSGGWYLVCADGYSLGWGKVSNGSLKNKYPAGWRLM